MSFLNALKTAETDVEVELNLCLCLCERFNTPHSLAIFMAIDSGDFLLYKELKPNPEDYLDFSSSHNLLGQNNWPSIERFRNDYLVSCMLRKSSNIPTSIDTASVALDLFEDIEKELEERDLCPAPNFPWLLELQHELSTVLSDGDVFLTHDVLEEVLERGQFGPGSSTDVVGAFVNSDKLRSPTSVSPALLPFLPSIKQGQWLNDQPDFLVTKAVKILTVPKTAYTDRTISQVPTANMFLQKGLASIIEDRLRLFGVNIRDQNRNQTLAKRARELRLATIDLSSASSWFSEKNTLTIFPPELSHFVDLVRPQYWFTSRDIESGPFKPKFMYNLLPMGCAYTFPLMTAFFYALVRTIVPRSSLNYCSVYGDDIILPQRYASILIDRLSLLGFKVNESKSFLKGNFFESCGSEWFSNYDVRPFYCRKGEASKCPTSYRIQLANKLRLWSTFNGLCDSNIRAIWDSLVKKVPKIDRFCVPPHFGDVGLITSLSESCYEPYEKALQAGWERIYRIKTLHLPAVRSRYEDSFPYLLWLMRHKHLNSEPVPTRFVKYEEPTGNRSHIDREAQYYPMGRYFAGGGQAPYGCRPSRGDPLALHTNIENSFSNFACPPFKEDEPRKGLFSKPRPKYVLTHWDPEYLLWSDRC